MSTSDIYAAYEHIKSRDFTRDEIGWLETEVRDEAGRQSRAGNGERASKLHNRADHLRFLRSEARLATFGDQYRLERDHDAFIRALPAAYAKAERARRSA